jgi:hypothetical protein
VGVLENLVSKDRRFQSVRVNLREQRCRYE